MRLDGSLAWQGLLHRLFHWKSFVAPIDLRKPQNFFTLNNLQYTVLDNYDKLLSFCLLYIVIADFTDILALEIDVYYNDILSPKFPQIQSQSIYFIKISWGGMPPDSPSISMLCMLIVLCTITHAITHYTKYHTLTMCPWSEKIHLILGSHSLFTSRRIIPLAPHAVSLNTPVCPLGQNPEINHGIINDCELKVLVYDLIVLLEDI